jgi:hypothetical protein
MRAKAYAGRDRKRLEGLKMPFYRVFIVFVRAAK